MYPPPVPLTEPSMVELTPKERLVHDLLVFEGLTDGEMAQRLGMTERAIKFHVQNLLQKTQAPDRFKMAVAFWREWSGYDEQVPDAPRPVRRRDDRPNGARRAAALRKKVRSGRKAAYKRKSMTNAKVSSKKKSAQKASAVRKKASASASRKPTASSRRGAGRASSTKTRARR